MNVTLAARVARKSHTAALLVGLGSVLVFGALAYGGQYLLSQEHELVTLQQELASIETRHAADVLTLRQQMELSRNELSQLEQQRVSENGLTSSHVGDLEREIDRLRMLALLGLGYRQPEQGSAERLEESLKARDLAQKLAKSGNERRSRVRLRYYPSDFDRHLNGDMVLPTLSRAGYQLEEAGVRVASAAPNSVRYGSAVTADDARLVALLLESAGVEIRSLQRFPDADAAHADIVEVGIDWSVEGKPALTSAEVASFIPVVTSRPVGWPTTPSAVSETPARPMPASQEAATPTNGAASGATAP